MLTEFGQFLRKLRIDHDVLLKDMAEKLGVTASYLSAVETGKRNIPDNWIERIIMFYNLDFFAQETIKKAAQNSINTVKMNLNNMSSQRRDTVLTFARQFNEVDESTLRDIRKLLNK